MVSDAGVEHERARTVGRDQRATDHPVGVLESPAIGAVEVDADPDVGVVGDRAEVGLERQLALHALRREPAVVGAADQLLLRARRVVGAGEDRVEHRVRARGRIGEHGVEIALADEAVDLAPRAIEDVAVRDGLDPRPRRARPDGSRASASGPSSSDRAGSPA